MHDLLFENQLHLKAKNLRRYAEEAKVDLERYDYEVNDHVYLQPIQEHIDGGISSGVRATPTFFVNGIVHDVSFGLEHLQQAIEAELGLHDTLAADVDDRIQAACQVKREPECDHSVDTRKVSSDEREERKRTVNHRA